MTSIRRIRGGPRPPGSPRRKRGRSPRRWGWLKRDQLGYAIVWFVGLAMGAWLF